MGNYTNRPHHVWINKLAAWLGWLVVASVGIVTSEAAVDTNATSLLSLAVVVVAFCLVEGIGQLLRD